MTDQEWFGREHTLIVKEVGDPLFAMKGNEITDYEIIHLPTLMGCRTEERSRWDDVTWTVYSCDIGSMVEDGDLAFSLSYSGTPITDPGIYTIQGWGRKYYVWDCATYEYDNGIAVIDDDS